MKEKFYYIRSAFFILIGLPFLFFYRAFLPSIPYIVAGVMFIYVIEGIINIICTKSIGDVRFFDNIIVIILAVIMVVIGGKNLSTACIIWAVWSICRESFELEEIYKFRKVRFTLIISAIESVAVIIFSILMIANPSEHHAMTHTILLGVELLFHGIIPSLNEHVHERKLKKHDEGEIK